MKRILLKSLNLIKKKRKIKKRIVPENTRKKFYADGTVNDYENGI